MLEEVRIGRADERVLHDVVELRVVARQTQDHASDVSAVSQVQPAEGVLVSAQNARHEDLVGVRLRARDEPVGGHLHGV